MGEGWLTLAGGLLALLFLVLGQIASWLPAWLPSSVPWWALLLAVLGAALLLLPSGVPLRLPGLFLLLPALLVQSKPAPHGLAQVWVFDVGQGLSVLVRTREHALLYDAGPSFGDFDMGERVVLPSLRALDVRRLDLLLLSHADNDHAGGAGAIVHGLPVAQVRSGEVERLAPELQAEPCTAQRWQWDDVEFQLWRWAEGGRVTRVPASCGSVPGVRACC